jgi:nucleoside-diphosphate-sugar epimerase
MGNVLVTGGPGLVGSRVILRLLAAGRAVRTMLVSPTHAAEARAVVDTDTDVRPGARLSVIAADRDHDASRLDAVAGGEFVDDRIRLLE